jgi:hypothetical protein
MPRVTPSPPPQAKPHTDAAAGANLRMENVEEAIRLERLGTAAAARDTFRNNSSDSSAVEVSVSRRVKAATPTHREWAYQHGLGGAAARWCVRIPDRRGYGLRTTTGWWRASSCFIVPAPGCSTSYPRD